MLVARLCLWWSINEIRKIYASADKLWQDKGKMQKSIHSILPHHEMEISTLGNRLCQLFICACLLPLFFYQLLPFIRSLYSDLLFYFRYLHNSTNEGTRLNCTTLIGTTFSHIQLNECKTGVFKWIFSNVWCENGRHAFAHVT